MRDGDFFSMDSLAQSRVLCVGDVILDQYVYGAAHRLSPEAPIPVFEHQQSIFSLGGAANVAANIATMGGHCTLISLCGQDAAAETLRQTLSPHTTVHPIFLHEDSRPTSLKTRYVLQSKQVLRVDQEHITPINKDTESALMAAVKKVIPNVSMVVLSDYGKGLLTPALCHFVMEQAKAHNLPVLVDPKGKDYRKYRGATLITPNRQELAEASGLSVATDDQVVAACETIMKTFDIKGMVATRSEQGMTGVWAGSVFHRPTRALSVYDVTGAGDTVVAFLAMALSIGQSLETAMDLANIAAGLVVQKRGTATLTPFEVRRAYRQSHPETLSDLKLTDPRDVRDYVKTWRDQGLSIGFTNGCFDLLHLGHIQLLAFARARCDRLVVGINSDASVKRLKGPTRPINDEITRQKILAALEAVDAVVLFDDDTPAALIADIAPDYLIKGGDYTLDTIVGAPEILARGGRVDVFPTIKGHSSTGTIERVQGAKEKEMLG
jgi:D-beta-D-heptose 7-phosphate kinase/D-beta-D-heptose 1-phosphate adenosyltransferase